MDEVTVGLGLSPVISWSPACAASVLTVREDGILTHWSIGVADGRGALTPPVTYGLVPPGAHENTPVTPLVMGRQYEVKIWPSPCGLLCAKFGEVTFTAAP